MILQNNINRDIEEIEDVILKIEKSYEIKFETNELSYVQTFGELCDHIILKLKQHQTNDCTSQQAFYKLKEAILTSNELDKSSIRTDTTLSSIFPRYSRRKQIATLQTKMGFKLNVLRPKHSLSWATVILFLGSIVELFFNWKLGLISIVISILLIQLVSLTGKEFIVKTIGQLADEISQESYLKSRRNPSSINRNEIVKKIEELFIHELALSKTHKKITPETIIVERK